VIVVVESGRSARRSAATCWSPMNVSQTSCSGQPGGPGRFVWIA